MVSYQTCFLAALHSLETFTTCGNKYNSETGAWGIPSLAACVFIGIKLQVGQPRRECAVSGWHHVRTYVQARLVFNPSHSAIVYNASLSTVAYTAGLTTQRQTREVNTVSLTLGQRPGRMKALKQRRVSCAFLANTTNLPNV